MTDQELHRLAAKAAGVRWEGFADQTSNWAPLHDDGDALRLAMALGIDLEWRSDGRVAAYRHATSRGYCFTAFESSREDRSANTRRAIVRAAAEIGKAMP